MQPDGLRGWEHSVAEAALKRQSLNSILTESLTIPRTCCKIQHVGRITLVNCSFEPTFPDAWVRIGGPMNWIIVGMTLANAGMSSEVSDLESWH